MWKALSYFPETYKNQYLRPENLRKLQEKRLRFVVDFAYRNTPLYKEKFNDAHITPHDIETLDDVTKIPLITKGEIKRVFPQGIITPGFSEYNCQVETTSGSSGSVLKVLYDPETAAYNTAIAFRDHFAQGVRPWHTFCIMCRDPVEFQSVSKRTFLYRAVGIPEGRPEEEQVDILRGYDPDVLGGHPALFAAMAKIIEKKGITDICPKLILLGGEMAYPHTRQYIEKVFGGRTLNKYGAYEINSIAWECSCRSMHIDADHVLLEVLKEGEPVSPGERGEIVVTSLTNKAMPFIRYRLEDVGVLSDELCACRRTLPLLGDLEGKCDDFIVLPSGELVPSTRVVPFFFIVPQIGEFKLIQDKKAHIVAKIVPEDGFTEDMEKTLLQNLKEVLGDSVDIEVEKVDHLEQTGSGKYKRVHRTYAVDLPFEKQPSS